MLELLTINPFREAEALFKDFDRLMSDFLVCNFEPGEHAGWLPDVDISSDEGGHTIVVDLPGVDPSGVQIALEGRQMTLRGARTFGKESGEGKGLFSRAFVRSFSLPVTADTENISATSEHGVLRISVPKKPEAKPKQIEISVQKTKKLE